MTQTPCNTCRNFGIRTEQQLRAESGQQRASRELFCPIQLYINRHTDLESAEGIIPDTRADQTGSTLSPPGPQIHSIKRTKTMQYNMNTTLVRARSTPTISSHIQSPNMTAAEIQDKKINYSPTFKTSIEKSNPKPCKVRRMTLLSAEEPRL